MSRFLKRLVTKNLSNVPGWSTNQRIVVFESDDWGSIRMPSRNTFEILTRAGIDLTSADAERYNKNDTLEDASDLQYLFEVLGSFKTPKGSAPIFTPVTLVANPDFKRIRECNYENYYYEPFYETLERQTGDNRAFVLWREGINNNLFVPQSHGREHLNVAQWMRALRRRDKHTLLAFQHGVTGFVPSNFPVTNYQAAFLLDEPEDIEYHRRVIIEGLDLFYNIFGFNARYFVPPNGQMHNALNRTLKENGIQFRSAAKIQEEPQGLGASKQVVHWLGQKDRVGIRYITRNCLFEPNHPGRDWVDSCMNDINIAFRWNKPAIISTHRVNYIGSLNSVNRDQSLRKLSILLKNIITKWPDVEFMTTAGLGQLMINSTN